MKASRPLIGVVHLPPLPGAPRHGGGGGLAATARSALRDVRVLEEEGFDGVLLENFGDAPFLPGPVGPETVAAMAVLLDRVVAESRVPVGVNVLRNDARAALALCVASGARFFRVNVHTGVTATDQGLIEGKAWETLRERERLGSDAVLMADVLVKHGAPLGPADPDPADAARDAVSRGLADALLVTGAATGAPVDEDVLRAVREAVPGTPVLLASGLDPRNAPRLFPLADGAVVGTSVKRGGVPGGPVDRGRARRLVSACRRAETR
jgi:membrane complex biogenesis BtpA family protein